MSFKFKFVCWKERLLIAAQILVWPVMLTVAIIRLHAAPLVAPGDSDISPPARMSIAAAAPAPVIPSLPSHTQIVSNRLQSLVSQYGSGKISLPSLSAGAADMVVSEEAPDVTPGGTNNAPFTNHVILLVSNNVTTWTPPGTTNKLTIALPFIIVSSPNITGPFTNLFKVPEGNTNWSTNVSATNAHYYFAIIQ